MGCHTWFKVKVDRTLGEARKKWIDKQCEYIDMWKRIRADPKDDSRVTYNWSQQMCDWALSVHERQLRMVEKGLCNLAVMNNQPDDECGQSYYFVNGGLYCEPEGFPHDIFRVGDYPEDNLLSFDETINFCEKNDVKLSQEKIDRLKDFWDKNQNGLICFG